LKSLRGLLLVRFRTNCGINFSVSLSRKRNRKKPELTKR
jgi:hypothetical protein